MTWRDSIHDYPKAELVRLDRKNKKYKTLQASVLERDGFRCQDCGCYTQAPPHHKVLLSRGGSDTMDNMTTLCGPSQNDCHAKVHRG